MATTAMTWNLPPGPAAGEVFERQVILRNLLDGHPDRKIATAALLSVKRFESPAHCCPRADHTPFNRQFARHRVTCEPLYGVADKLHQHKN